MCSVGGGERGAAPVQPGALEGAPIPSRCQKKNGFRWTIVDDDSPKDAERNDMGTF